MMKNGLLKGVFTLLALLLVSVSFAEDSYRAALRRYTEYSNTTASMAAEKLAPKLAGVAVGMYGYELPEATVKAEKFCQEHLLDAVLDWMEESYKGIVSESDIKAACDFFQTESGSLALAHSSVYNNDEAQQKMVQQMLPAIMKLVEGKKAPKVTTDAPSSYVKAFHEYYKVSGLEEMLVPTLRTIAKGDGDYDKKFLSYMEDNIENLLIGLGYPTVTVEDLQLLSQFYKGEEGSHITQANVKLMSNAMAFGMKLVQDFAEYAKK